MKYGPTWELRRTGCAVVVVSVSGDLVAFGNAVPPSWVRTDAAAELWTLLLVATASVVQPLVVTDCMSIFSAAETGTSKVTDPSKPYAQIWAQIATALDDAVSMLVSQHRLRWMPAHGAVATIGRARR